MDLHQLTTEQRNDRTMRLDEMSVHEVLEVMNDEDRSVPDAVARALPQIEQAVDLITASLRAGGRLIYVGAGTSGRLALLDAVECPPTFDTDPDRVVAFLAGGPGAFVNAVEGAEDDADAGAFVIDAAAVGEHDTVVGLAASGRTPYVVGALRRACERGASTVGISCNAGSLVGQVADVAIEVATGPEVVTGSTRLKAGTAQKLVCNMLTTASMVQLGKVHENLMIDVRPINEKLVDRARRIVATAAGVEAAVAAAALAASGNRPKVATVMLLAGVSAGEAERRLSEADGSVRRAVG